MKSICENGNLIIFFEGRITSDTAEQITKEVDAIVAENSFTKITGNLNDLEYISSAGLRMFLHIKKENDTFNLIQVPPAVYEILDISGFVQMLPVKKMMRVISTADAKLLGRGYFSEVYKLGDETVVKKYVRNTSLEDIERECALAKTAFICGVPCAITYDVVKADECYGVVFEALNAKTMLEEFRENPSQREEIIEKYVGIFKQIHSTKAQGSIFPKSEDIWADKFETIKDYLTQEECEKLSGLLKTIPISNNFVHSDCHLGNIMRNGNEYMLIDMDTLATGNPIYELAPIYCTYVVYEEYDPNNAMEFLGISTEEAAGIFTQTMERYCEGLPERDYDANLDKVKLLGYFHILFWIKRNTPDNQGFYDFSYKQFKEYLAKVDDLILK